MLCFSDERSLSPSFVSWMGSIIQRGGKDTTLLRLPSGIKSSAGGITPPLDFEVYGLLWIRETWLIRDKTLKTLLSQSMSRACSYNTF